MTFDFDVIVIGSGAAGLSAALSARQAGAASVLVAEAEGAVGGSSRLSGGYVMGAGTRFQEAAGITDDAQALFRHYLTLNAWNIDIEVVRRLCEESGPAIEWLADLGVEFSDQLIYGGDEFVPRVHLPVERGEGIIAVLYRACRQEGVEFALGRRVDRILVDDDGRACGVAVGDDTITAAAVVITSGGFGNDAARLAEFFPSAARTEWAYYIGAPGSRGDHLDFADQAGAQLVGYDRGLRLVHANFDTMYESYLPGWLVLVNSEGHRFCDETAPYGILDNLMRAQGDRAWAIFDRAALEYSTNLGVARYKQYRPTTNTKQSPHWVTDVVDAMVREGKVQEAASVGELASRIGIPPANLEAAVTRVNQAAQLGKDVDFGKGATFLDPIATAPFYAAELRPATVCWTGYGLRIDRNAQVLSEAGLALAGLFAAGECTGGVIGPVYVGSGNSYANCVTYGRIAGASAATVAAGRVLAP